MIPLRDDTPSSRFPIVNWLLIAACLLVFLIQQSAAGEGALQGLIGDYALVPARVTGGEHVVLEVPVRGVFGGMVERVELPPAAVPEWLTLLTCIFLHGSWLHLLGNLWVLYIFGDNVEDRFGRLAYLVFYLLSGAAASATHLLSDPHSPMPTVGASGAIAGVMGAYVLLYPHARVLALIPLGIFLQLAVVPAYLFLGLWFLLQLLAGATTGGTAGGVAWWAHIGGFAVGLGATAVLRALGFLRPAVPTSTLTARRFDLRRARSRPRDGWF